jgi:hypothetical protein
VAQLSRQASVVVALRLFRSCVRGGGAVKQLRDQRPFPGANLLLSSQDTDAEAGLLVGDC